MKKKLFILVPLFVLIIAAVTPLTAFASTGYPTSYKQAESIVRSYSTELGLDNSVPVCLYTYKNKPCMLYLPKDRYDSDTITVSKYNADGEGLDFFVNDQYLYVLSFSSSNMYSKPTVEFRGANRWMTVPGMTKNNISDVIIGSSKTILDTDGSTVLFRQGTNPSPTPIPTPNPKPTQNSKLISSISSTILSPVLSEVVAILPTLVPVLVALLAIRKGLAFTLQTLKTS